jgi:phage major head subunit gpT-like protein
MSEQLSISDGQIIGALHMALEKSLAGSWMSQAAFPTQSKQKVQQYRWLGMAPAFRQWIGGRHTKGLRSDTTSLTNLKFEATLGFEVDDLNRDNWGQCEERITDMANRTVEHWEMLGTGCLALGDTAPCYDGQPFFSASHEEGKSGTQTNLLTALEVPALNVGTPTNPTAEELSKAIIGCIGHQYGLKDDQGELINGEAQKFLVMVPVSMFVAALAAVSARFLVNSAGTGAVDNQLVMAIEGNALSVRAVVNPRLEWTDSFAVLRTDARAKPLIRQEEYPVKVSRKGEGGDYEHDFDRREYGLKASRNVGYAYWQYALKATLS